MIAIVYPQFYGVGGIARYLDSFLKSLPADGPKIFLITGDVFPGSRTYKNVEVLHLPLGTGRFSLLRWSVAASRQLTELHKSGKIKLVNLHIPPLIPGLFLPKSVPMILTAHTTYLGMTGLFYAETHFKNPWGRLSTRIKMCMERLIFERASEIITLTEQGRQEVLRYQYPGKVHVIPNGVDMSSFVAEAAVSKDIDVLFVGRIEIRKGSRPMVEVCKRLVAVDPGIKIMIVGYGDDDAYVQEHLGRMTSNVQLAGKVPFEAVRGFYNRSRLYASTSYYEGLPGTCLEAMAMGLPVVVWNFLFYEGLVVPGQNGYVIPVNDIDSFVAKVIEIKNGVDGGIDVGRAGRNLMAESYDWQSLARHIVEKFQSVKVH